jgi:hypothetical protein
MGNIEKVSGNSISSHATGGASMISLGLRCPACQKKMSVPDHAMGRRVQCPACEHVFRYTGQRDLTLGRILHGVGAATPRPAPMLSEELRLGDTLPMSKLDLDFLGKTDKPATLPKTEKTIHLVGDDEIADLLSDEPTPMPDAAAASVEDSPVDIVDEIVDDAEVTSFEDVDEVAEIEEVEEVEEIVEEDEPDAVVTTPTVVDEAIDDLLADDVVEDDVVADDEVAEVEEVADAEEIEEVVEAEEVVEVADDEVVADDLIADDLVEEVEEAPPAPSKVLPAMPVAGMPTAKAMPVAAPVSGMSGIAMARPVMAAPVAGASGTMAMPTAMPVASAAPLATAMPMATAMPVGTVRPIAMAAPVAQPALPKSPVPPPTPASARKADSDIDLDALLANEPLAKFPGESDESTPTMVADEAVEPIIESLDDDIVADLEVAETVAEPVAFAEPVIESLDDEVIVEAESVEPEHAPIHHLEAPLPLLGAEAPEELVEAVEEIDAVEELHEPATHEALDAEALDAEFASLFAEEPTALADPPTRGTAKPTDREIDLDDVHPHDGAVAPAVPMDEEVIEDVFMFEDEPPAKK